MKLSLSSVTDYLGCPLMFKFKHPEQHEDLTLNPPKDLEFSHSYAGAVS